MISALEAEVAAYVAHHQERDDTGRALVVRNGRAQPRNVTVGSGTFEIRAPRVNDQRTDADGDRVKSLRRDEEHLLTFFSFPAEHW